MYEDNIYTEYRIPRIAVFEKVSFDEFKKDWIKTVIEPENRDITEGDLKTIREIYDNIKLPQRATVGSAGYDFFAPTDFQIACDDSINIPTGIRCKISDGWVLTAYPRSGHGFKFGIRLANSVGVIDSDYYFADNEGHIFVKLVNESVLGWRKEFKVNQGDAMCQGIFLPFGITENDEAEGQRTGGFGSTDKK